jgi:hypothetical protein
MRPDQIQRLQDLSESLADRFIDEADPSGWPGGGMLPADMSQQERGDSYWCKKNAMATGGVLRYVIDLRAKVAAGGASGDPDAAAAAAEADMDRGIREAQRRAAEAVSLAMGKASAVDARGHGRAG